MSEDVGGKKRHPSVVLPFEQESVAQNASFDSSHSDSSPTSHRFPLLSFSRSSSPPRHQHHNIPSTTTVAAEPSSLAASSAQEGASNERLLGTAFVSFMSFALVQLCFAFIAGSQAMVGDSAAMIVDALTYLFNWIAEVRKNRFDRLYTEASCTDVASSCSEADRRANKRRRERAKRKMVLQLEIYPPLISVLTLIVVVALVMRRSIIILVLDMHRPRDQQRIPNVNLMLAFSIFNLALDGLNMYCFASANHLMGYDVTDETEDEHMRSPRSSGNATATTLSTYRHVDDDEDGGNNLGTRSRRDEENPQDQDVGHDSAQRSESDSDDSNQEESHANLNMCSAYTHVFADTLRSFAVIFAAGVAEVVPRVSPEVADASAALIVSILIFLSLFPLFQGLVRSFSELRSITAEETSEAMFLERRSNGESC